MTTKRTRATRPLRSARITGHPRYYEPVRPYAPTRYSAPHSFRCLGCSLSPAVPTPDRRRRGDRFPRSVPMPDLSSRHLYAGHHLASQQAPARLVPGQRLDPGFDDIATLSTLPQWFTHVRLLGSHLTPSRAPFPQRSPPRLIHRRSLRWFATSPCAGGRGGPTSITGAAPHPNAPSSTPEPPSAFLAHNRPHTARSGSWAVLGVVAVPAPTTVRWPARVLRCARPARSRPGC